MTPERGNAAGVFLFGSQAISKRRTAEKDGTDTHQSRIQKCGVAGTWRQPEMRARPRSCRCFGAISVDVSTEDGSYARFRVRLAIESLARTQRGPQKPLEALRAVRHAQHELSDARDFWTAAARRSGATWTQIGRALDMSRQAAQQSQRRRQIEAEQRAEAVRVWRLPPPPRRRRFRWPFRRAA
jgi:hypothetical protein